MLIAGATNLGLTRMAEACGVPYDVLAWTQEWYVREDTLREANTVIVNYHHSLELTKVFGNATDLPIREHSTDTHGVTLVNFTLFDLVGIQLSPRIRDLGKITLVRDGTPTTINQRYRHAGRPLTARWNEDLVRDCWDDLLRRTVHAARYLADPAYRRKIARQPNKGESLHALRRDLHYAQQGTVTRPHLVGQSEQAWCLTVLTNTVVTWSTEYCSLAVKQLRAQGRDVPDELLAHISSARNENINFFGVITSDVEEELARLDPAGGWRPLHPQDSGLLWT